MKNQGQGDLDRGLPNMGQHIKILKGYGVPVVAAVNRFPTDTEADLKRLAAYCADLGVNTALSEGFTKGGARIKSTRRNRTRRHCQKSRAQCAAYVFAERATAEKVKKVAQKVYGADGVNFSEQAAKKLEEFPRGAMASCPSASQKHNIP